MKVQKESKNLTTYILKFKNLKIRKTRATKKAWNFYRFLFWKCKRKYSNKAYSIRALKMLSKFILSRFREVGRSNDQTKNNGWYRRKYLRGGSSINACKHCKQLRQRFRSRHRFSTFLASACVTLSCRRSFFLFHPFFAKHIFSCFVDRNRFIEKR